MPQAPIPFCPTPGCTQRSRGPCKRHRAEQRQRTDLHRGSRQSRGYNRAWEKLVAAFPSMLVARGLVPKCGAKLSGVPSEWSQCHRQGRITTTDLQLDHDPKLEDWERSHPERVCDPARCGLLCSSCHGAKTRAEMIGGHQ